ncbi:MULTISPECIES: ribose-phosphate pyrophosphokinase [Legionella]|uniref:Ribose-phosphate pyrophosphokinase n=1 Tax=Legionella septentrionalis TaxID=2498109 RepID=A0A3S0WSV0_9GAMM|nr:MULTISPECIES: ribose-phosphate pyrophosphokinase [Legionella]MCP0913940.1 ribose-phosphate pyrophosphokinase [Legionella sp. 27cVA30]RUQ90397.1 ribose-phosphate pyrophosphokinase [Legionella septentrionalis]RUR00048.1 ribose-phosphate pyrophosphokinase [Legionella septentrionalis]RUR10744.1 ribose-phosphate pyrophosphokinase [Legionella septentrionalis]RUR16503.1 ribose-phosphate pyrophosphokinase [Legionella septentrionalis]
MSTMMIFAGNANPALAQKIASYLNLPIGQATVGTFSDGETMVEILENVRGRDVFIIQPTCAPSNNNLMELLVMADALRRSSAGRITAVVPYFGYARQDRRVRSARVPITAKVVADMMTSVGICRVLTVDLHADQIQGFFCMPVDNVYSTPILLEDIKQQQLDNIMVISPDVGGVVRARAMAKRLNDAELSIIDKRRSGPNKSEVMHIIGEPKGRNCLIIDDIVDTAGTLCSAAHELKKNGAASVRAYVTHPVLSGPAIENISHSVLDEVVVTDTIPLSEQAAHCKKIRVVSLAEMLAQAIKRVNEEESVSSMFVDKM